VADTPKPGRGRPLPERFEVFEAHPTAHLTEEQRTWKVMKPRRGRERFEILEQQPTLILRLHLRHSLDATDPVALAGEIVALYHAVSEMERELGGGGLVMSDERVESGSVVLVLRHVVVEGAAGRAAKLSEVLANRTPPDPLAGVLKLLDAAAQSPVTVLLLILASARTYSSCEVILAAA
jgi:hypothetical protein